MLSSGILQTRYTTLIIVLRWNLTEPYTTGSVARRAAYFGSSSYGPVSIGSIQCSGSDTRLQDCGLSQTPSSSCTHSQDAGVTCVGKHFCLNKDLKLALCYLYTVFLLHIYSLRKWRRQACWWFQYL